MGKVYYNQADPRWGSHPYPSNERPNATIKSGGCGVTCAAMVVSSLREIIHPDSMGDIARENGYRRNGGTAWEFFQYVADRWNIKTKSVKSSYEALEACKEGYYVVILCGSGLWTTGGHYILAVGSEDDKIEIYDPYLYAGKFDRYGRSGKVEQRGNSCFVQIGTFKANSEARAFFAYKVDNTDTPAPVLDPKVKYVNTKSANLNVRNGKGGTVIGSLAKGTQVLVYEESDGWSRIGDTKWVSSQYLSDNNPNNLKKMYVKNVSTHLNVREGAGTNYNKIGTLNNSDEVIVDKTENGWCHITSPMNGWVSADYLSDNGSESKPVGRNTVGQIKRFSNRTIIYEKSNLSGKQYPYLSKTQIKILANISDNVDKIYVVKTGRIGYVNINSY